MDGQIDRTLKNVATNIINHREVRNFELFFRIYYTHIFRLILWLPQYSVLLQYMSHWSRSFIEASYIRLRRRMVLSILMDLTDIQFKEITALRTNLRITAFWIFRRKILCKPCFPYFSYGWFR